MQRAVLTLLFLFTPLTALAADAATYDVVVYGGTSSGVIAAVQAAKMGKSVVLVGPDKHLGGLSAGGLGWTDSGKKDAIGGLSREFYHRLWKYYQQPSAWPWQKKEQFGNRNQSPPSAGGDGATIWVFEPHAAEQVFEDFVTEYKIPVHRDEWLDRENGVQVEAGRIRQITMLSGKTFAGRMFIDATYEGDLLAAAGVSFHVGREANSVYNERYNGIQTGVLHHGHWFKKPVDPYVTPGDPTSGLLPRVSAAPPGEKNAGDHRIQAYCFRMCLTNHDKNRIPFPKPEGYDPKQYELLLRVFETGWRETFGKFDPIQNFKTDTNNHGPFSTDNIGMNYDYPEGSYARRKEIIAEHETYQKGLMYFLANDPRVPEEVRSKMATWGLPRDEFTDNGGWPHQIYVREARRMIGAYVMTEHDCLDKKVTPQSVGMGSYTLDSHNVQRYVKPDGYVQNEGDIGVHAPRPYEISYGSLTPKRDEVQNLLAPVCVSSSHIAYGSIRMEPVFMILGQSAATAACLSIDANNAPVQDLPYETLRERLLADGQVLELDSGALAASQLGGIVVDDDAAKLTGEWSVSHSQPPYIGGGYRHDSNEGDKSALFTATLKPGTYEVRLAYSPFSNRATNVPVTVIHAEGSTTMEVNQQQPPPKKEKLLSLGRFVFKSTGAVQISNKGADGHVILDAVQFLPVE